MIAVLVDGTRKTSSDEATRATGGHTSGESAPRGVGQWHGAKADTSESSAMSQGAKRGALRRGSGRPEPRRGTAPAPGVAWAPRSGGAGDAGCARSPRPRRDHNHRDDLQGTPASGPEGRRDDPGPARVTARAGYFFVCLNGTITLTLARVAFPEASVAW